MTFFGDVLPRKPYSVETAIPGIPVVNLEGPICEPLHPWPNTVNLSAPEYYLRDIFGDGPLVACLANNHIMDYGEAGFDETIKHLESEGTQYFGAGSIDEQVNNPLYIAFESTTVALLGYVSPSTHPVYADRRQPGVSPLTFETIRADIGRVQEAGVDQIIACLHWGPEEVSLPRPEDVRLARRVIDAGADLIIGHHPHRVQPYEVYDGQHIFYSVGNCMMPELDEPSGFDDNGQPQRRYVKRQFSWHRNALGVTYCPSSRSIQMSMYHFDGQRLVSQPYLKCPSELYVRNLKVYRRRYKRAYYLGKLRYKLHTVLSKRKLPGFGSLKSIISIVKELREGAQE